MPAPVMPSVVSPMMTVAAIAGILILVNGFITISAVLAYAVHVAASILKTSSVLIAGSVDTGCAVADTSVLAYAVHITEIIASTVTIFIAGSVGRPANHLCSSGMMTGVGKNCTCQRACQNKYQCQG